MLTNEKARTESCGPGEGQNDDARVPYASEPGGEVVERARPFMRRRLRGASGRLSESRVV